MSRQVLHMIGNAHIDPVWLWGWREGFQEVKATFRSALDRLNETDDFLFVSSSALFYWWIEHNAPSMFEEIRQRVREGRWEIVGGWLIQPDCNIPCGESFVRQGLYGQRYFYNKFGVTAKTGYNVDSFGHHGMLPQILKKSGMENYVFMRPGPHEKGLPGHVFWWESDDGSRVLAARILFEYCTWSDDLKNHVTRCANELREPVNQLMCFYGVGNHGGGPTKANLRSIGVLSDDPNLPELRYSTPNRYFEAMLSETIDLPVVHDDLQHHAPGCYAAHSEVKAENRRAEQSLITSETWSAVSSWHLGRPYEARYEDAWRHVLFNQFHDILAGTSIERAYQTARDGYGFAITIADEACNAALQSLSWGIGIHEEDDTFPFVVFNTHSWAVCQSVEVEFAKLPSCPILLDPQGQELQFQEIPAESATILRKRIVFIADLPPLGYKVYRLQGRNSTHQSTERGFVATQTSMENDHLKLRLDPDTGYVVSLYDKLVGHEVFAGPAAVPIVLDDPSDTWSHGVSKFDRPSGAFQVTDIELVADGPVKAAIRVTSHYGQSTLVQDFTMYRDLKYVKVDVMVDWREHFQVLKLKFPLNLHFYTATYEIPYGQIVRPTNGEEEPGQSWIDLSGIAPDKGTAYGMSLLNSGKYSFHFDGNEMNMTVLRSPMYAHHEPFVPQESPSYPFTDQGIQRFRYVLLPHRDGWREAQTVMRASELNQEPIVIPESFHEGPLPQFDTFIHVSEQNIVVTSIKQAEEEAAMVVRCRETSQVRTTVSIHFPVWGREITTDFAPNEIKTFLIPREPDYVIREVNLLEWDMTSHTEDR